MPLQPDPLAWGTEHNIYAIVSENRYNGINVEESRELLCRYGADGQPGYRTPLDRVKVHKF
nr:hypothetical protein [uncultured Acetatifactor sp.]